MKVSVYKKRVRSWSWNSFSDPLVYNLHYQAPIRKLEIKCNEKFCFYFAQYSLKDYLRGSQEGLLLNNKVLPPPSVGLVSASITTHASHEAQSLILE